jgi:hypothetical protein
MKQEMEGIDKLKDTIRRHNQEKDALEDTSNQRLYKTKMQAEKIKSLNNQLKNKEGELSQKDQQYEESQ